MSIPYTYLIKHLPTGMLYYGVRYAKNCDPKDLWVKYFTSSNKVKTLIKEYGINSFKIEIRKIFTNEENAIKWEKKVLKRMKIPHRIDFLNCRYTYAIPSMSKESHPLWGVGHTEISKQKMSISHTGKVLSEKTKFKMSKSRTGSANPCFEKFGINHPAYGNKHTNEFKNNMSERLKLNNPMSNKESREKMSATKRGRFWWNDGIHSTQSVECPNKEWVRGRLKQRKDK